MRLSAGDGRGQPLRRGARARAPGAGGGSRATRRSRPRRSPRPCRCGRAASRSGRPACVRSCGAQAGRRRWRDVGDRVVAGRRARAAPAWRRRGGRRRRRRRGARRACRRSANGRPGASPSVSTCVAGVDGGVGRRLGRRNRGSARSRARATRQQTTTGAASTQPRGHDATSRPHPRVGRHARREAELLPPGGQCGAPGRIVTVPTGRRTEMPVTPDGNSLHRSVARLGDRRSAPSPGRRRPRAAPRLRQHVDDRRVCGRSDGLDDLSKNATGTLMQP